MTTLGDLDITEGQGTSANRRTVLYLAISLAVGAVAVVHWTFVPVTFDDELSWVQLAQDAAYAIGLVLAILTARRLKSSGRDEWTVVALVAAGMFYCFWREAEMEEQFFHLPHMFSIAYLLKPEHKVPLWAKLTAGIPAITLMVLGAWWTWRRRRELKSNLRAVLRRRWFVVLIIAGVLLGAAQFIDRADSWRRRFGLNLPGIQEPQKRSLRNVEEIAELAGAVLVLCAMIEMRINLLARRREPPLGPA